MKIFLVDAGHPSVPGNPRKAFLSQAGADAYAAELVNILLENQTEIAKVTAANWADGIDALLAAKALEDYDEPIEELGEDEIAQLNDEMGFVEIEELELLP